NLTIGGGAKLTPSLVSDLTASIPRDVVTGAQQQWLPNLAAETANGPSKNNHGQSGSNAVTEEATSTQSASEDQSGSDVPQAAPVLNAQGADSTVSGETDTAEIKPA